MKHNWEVKKLGEVCDFVRGPFGGSLKKSCFKLKGIAVYEQQHAIYDQFEEIRYFIDEKKFNEMQRFEVAPGDLIMSCSGTMGKVAIVPDSVRKGVINQALLKLSPNNNLFARFLKLWMGSSNFQEQLTKYSLGAAIKNVASVKMLKEIEILLPPLPEQQRIVAILDEAFAAIATAKGNAEKNLKKAHELFESYFQFVFANPKKGWEQKRLGEVCGLMTGGTPSRNIPEYFVNGEIKWLVSGDIHKKEIYDCEGRITKEGMKNSNAKYLPINSVIIALNGQGKTRGTVAMLYTQATCNQSLVSIYPNKSGVIISKYIYCNLNGRYKEIRVITGDAGNERRGLNMSLIGNIKIPIPSFSEQKYIVAKLDALSAETKKLEAIYKQKLADLDELKKALLQKAFNGEL